MALIDDLISYWKLDESSGNAADSHGSNTLTNTNSVAFATGKINNGADFENSAGEDQYFTVADSVSLSITGDISIQAWVKPESAPGADEVRTLVGKWFSTGDQRSYSFQYLDEAGTKKLRFTYVSNGIANDTESEITQTLSNGTWYHVVVTADVDAKVIKFYVDGTETTGTNLDANATAIFDATSSFSLGRLGDNDVQYWDGMMDEVVVWSRVLTLVEVTQLYNSGSGLAYPLVPTAAGNLLLTSD